MAVSGPQLVSARFPYLPVEITVGTSTLRTEALVDTGFDGALILPQGAIPASVVPAGSLPWALADDSRVIAPTYIGTVSLGPLGAFRVAISVLGNEAIIGRGLTDRFSVTFDHGLRVVAEP